MLVIDIEHMAYKRKPVPPAQRQESVNLTYDHGTALKLSSAIRNDVSHHRQAGCIPQTYARRFDPYIYMKKAIPQEAGIEPRPSTRRAQAPV